MKTFVAALLLLAANAFAQQPPDVVVVKPEPAVLSWQRNATNNTGVIIERAVNNAPYQTLFLSSDAAQVTISDLSLQQDGARDNRYCYRVANVQIVSVDIDPRGFIQSAYSNEACKVIKRLEMAPPSNLILSLEDAIKSIQQAIAALR